jgi:hypothetical protein
MPFKMNNSKLEKGMIMFEDKAMLAIEGYAETVALKLENVMRREAPWTNRTGMARKTLKGERLYINTGVRIALSYGVWYGVYLEFAHEKRFAIVFPTILKEGPKVMAGFNKLLERLVTVW